ncbi:MAG: hypothetical protein KGL39_15000 [Patescibacteria group bacterium]|nr:hypothetical protein [Patescibacteria group bacterium]
MKTAKLKLTGWDGHEGLVACWERENPVQYSLYLNSRKQKTELLSNKFAETPGSNFMLRLLYEIPEDLDIKIRMGLDSAENEWLKTDNGGVWFAKTFKQYNVSQHS